MKAQEERRYEAISPFELKNKLIELAERRSESMMLNAGRGNPNWVATEPRHAFFQFGHFSLAESEAQAIRPGFGGPPLKTGGAQRLRTFLETHRGEPGIEFLQRSLDYARNTLSMDEDAFVWELTDAILGDHYPMPDRILDFTDKMLKKFIDQEMCAGEPPQGNFDLFAVEGGTAAMDYIFNTLIENKVLHKGDKIALGVPIFTPYLEIPQLNDYQFVELEIVQDENGDWQYPDSELEKLKDPSIKALFTVNPSNPTSVSMSHESLKTLASLVQNERKDLFVITDDVYGTFVNGFKSIAAIIPHNTILVYSFSKYFGATGWRLGVIAIHEDNILDKKIATLPETDKKALHKRYGVVALEPEKMKLIERMVADSRSVALHHTAGLSTPQQVMMAFFALHALLDSQGEYKKQAQDIVSTRYETLYRALGSEHPNTPYDARYYTTIDIPQLAQQRYGEEFAKHLTIHYEPIDFVVQLAEKKGVVLMDGGGFDSPNMSVRVSLANLPDDAYAEIGTAISDLLSEYHAIWEKIQP